MVPIVSIAGGRLELRLPIVQAPMAGVSTPALAAAVSNAGGLGSLGLGAATAETARQVLADTRALTTGPVNLNVFCHQPAVRNATVERAWIERLAPEFSRYGAEPPQALQEIYRSFVVDDDMMSFFLHERPEVVSFHFGLPPEDRIVALRQAGIVLFATATSVLEAQALAAAGIDAVVAQGYEAGGHRGVFDPDAPDEQLGTLVLTRLLARELSVPVIAAGGIMDGAGIAAALDLGAAAAQLGTAFVGCPESQADKRYRAVLESSVAYHTVMTRVISGRPARCLSNRFTTWGADVAPADVPAYPVTYDAGKALHAAAKVMNEGGYGAYWAGQGAPLARSLPAAELVDALALELQQARLPAS